MGTCHLAPLPRMSLPTLRNRYRSQIRWHTVSSVFFSPLTLSSKQQRCTGGIFPSTSYVASGSPTESHATSGLFSRSNTISTGHSEPSQEDPLVAVAKPFDEPQPGPRAPARPRSEEPDGDLHVPGIHQRPVLRVPTHPQLREPRDDLHRAEVSPHPESWAPIPPRSEEPHDDLHVPEMYAHLGQRFTPPPSQLPEKKRKGFKHFKLMLREFFGLNR